VIFIVNVICNYLFSYFFFLVPHLSPIHFFKNTRKCIENCINSNSLNTTLPHIKKGLPNSFQTKENKKRTTTYHEKYVYNILASEEN
jgi:hypothetical protein